MNLNLLKITALLLGAALSNMLSRGDSEQYDIFGETCPEIERMQGFDPDRYGGLWFEAFRRKKQRFVKGDCNMVDISYATEQNIMSVLGGDPKPKIRMPKELSSFGTKPGMIRLKLSGQELSKDGFTRLPRIRAEGIARIHPLAKANEGRY